MAPNLDRLIYVDDSGRPQSGLVVYGWIEFSPDRWASILKSWLDMRKKLWREFSIPVTQELHTTAYVNGRGRIARKVPDRHMQNGVPYWKDFGRAVAVECLKTLRSAEGLRVGAVWRQGTPEDFFRTKHETYAALVSRFERRLRESDSLGLVIMDGDGSDSSYRSTHRRLKLTERRVIEDAIHLDSRSSQLVQIADLVAWCANAHIDRHDANEFAWEWYSTHLAERDTARGPQEI
ncbi:DUF3800 domain-containing protein [Mycetocola tolaasinivorans]|uniref:DUF3800 domain-containing protein n=1 Tax=Mycetocola tolaasinivorans TaxID=76635 RepID=A0A3L7A619_9MICO|nr:DUF3800 domain-containing protein [Mycetocola tolaasinivorans]RLP75554.1 DUF3800 domain-containing protein [Mycetocola tolaasinivorans]